MAFESPLVVEQVGEVEWELHQELVYRGRRDLFVVPTGTQTDFASVPSLFQWLIRRSGRHTKAAVLHDALWRGKANIAVSRSDADGLFRRAMADSEVPFLRRWVMWAAVRWASLTKSWFRDGTQDLPQLLLVTFLPGLLVIAGGVAIGGFLLAFWVVESIAVIVLAALRVLPATKVKPLVKPPMTWRS